MILKNKVCLLTGASGGLGKEIIKKLVKENIKIIALGRTKKNLIQLKKKYNKSVISIFPCDFRNIENTLNTIDSIKKKNIKIDIIINCAGNFLVRDFQKLSSDQINKELNINIIASMLITKEFLSNMKAKKWGRIVNIGSSSSYAGFAKTVVYCTAKHALLGFSRSINEEFKSYGIRSYIFSPGSIKTKMGKLVKKQKYKDFIEPNELSSLILSIIKQNNNMITEEIKINRINYN